MYEAYKFITKLAGEWATFDGLRIDDVGDLVGYSGLTLEEYASRLGFGVEYKRALCYAQAFNLSLHSV